MGTPAWQLRTVTRPELNQGITENRGDSRARRRIRDARPSFPAANPAGPEKTRADQLTVVHVPSGLRQAVPRSI